MSHEELEALLGLKPKTSPDSGEVVRGEEITTEDSTPPSPSVLELDPWDEAKGKEFLAENVTLQAKSQDDREISDFYGLAYKPDPVIQERVVDGAADRKTFIEGLLQQPETQSLRQATVLDEMTSEMATAQFLNGFLAWRGAEWERRRDAEQRGEDPDRPSEGEKLKQDITLYKAVQATVKQAKEEVESVEALAAMAGIGQGDGTGKVSKPTFLNMFRTVQNSPMLRRIAELAGRYRRLARARQKTKTVHGRDEIAGIVTGGLEDPLLPSELAGLRGERGQRLETLRKIAERQALALKFQGSEKLGKGPVVVCVDESGSMKLRERIHQAKALALALYWIARHQNRWCMLLGYSGGAEGNLEVFRPRDVRPEALLQWCSHFYNGGTTMNAICNTLPRRYWREYGVPEGKTDIVIVTDGEVRIDSGMEAEFNRWRQEKQVKVQTIVIGAQGKSLAPISDSLYSIADLTVESDGVEQILSI